MTDCRVLIADDEDLARERLRTLLANDPDFVVVGEARDGFEAVDLITELAPDVVLLDIDMPVLDGFGVVGQVGAGRMPPVVFVTAYHEHAIQAFEANAVDYLLKPVARERLRTALERARARIDDQPAARIDPRFLAWMDQNAPAVPVYRDRITVRSGQHFLVLKTESVTRVEAADNYVRLFAAGASYMLRVRMRDLGTLLDPRRFIRVHRSTMINAEFVERIEPWGLGEYLFVMSDGTRVSSSRGYKDAVREAFGV